MNSKHLATGEQCPPLIPGSLRIYSMRFCPYAQRALLAAAAKGIKYDVVNINLVNKPEFIFTKNPEGKVPTIETNDGHVLYESLIVSNYIDETYNKPIKCAGDSTVRQILATDPFQKALDCLWIEKFAQISSLDYKLYFPTNISSDEKTSLIGELNKNLLALEKELNRRGTLFFAGNDSPGMLDLMIWPWMERLPSLDLILADDGASLVDNLLLGRNARPTLGKWEQAMIKNAAVQASYLSPEIHAKYRQMRRSGAPVNYDFLN